MKLDDAFFTGFENGKLVEQFPIKVTKEVILRGQERFNIYCSHCHGKLGDGKGMIAQRGLVLARPPASYHTDRLREMPIGHFFDVITNGFGVMYRQAPSVDPIDRWAIAAWIRVLQLSQNGRVQDVPTDQINSLDTVPTAGKAEQAPAAGE
jgi:mono/diheme cytochrome c family protein